LGQRPGRDPLTEGGKRDLAQPWTSRPVLDPRSGIPPPLPFWACPPSVLNA
jgi:hypothetical protein